MTILAAPFVFAPEEKMTLHPGSFRGRTVDHRSWVLQTNNISVSLGNRFVVTGNTPSGSFRPAAKTQHQKHQGAAKERRSAHQGRPKEPSSSIWFVVDRPSLQITLTTIFLREVWLTYFDSRGWFTQLIATVNLDLLLQLLQPPTPTLGRTCSASRPAGAGISLESCWVI